MPIHILSLTHFHLDGLLVGGRGVGISHRTVKGLFYFPQTYLPAFHSCFTQEVNKLLLQDENIIVTYFHEEVKAVGSCWQSVNVRPPSEGAEPGYAKTRCQRWVLVNFRHLPRKVPSACTQEIHILVGSSRTKSLEAYFFTQRSADTIIYIMHRSSQNFMTA